MLCAVSESEHANGRSCPFAGAKLLEFDGKRWCSLHLPVSGADGRKSEKANWDLKKEWASILQVLEHREHASNPSASVDLSFAVFRNDFPAEIPGDWNLTPRAQQVLMPLLVPGVDGRVLFEGARFVGRVNSARRHWAEGSSFRFACFCESADFTEAQFGADVSFEMASFGKEVWFTRAHFSLARFTGAQFDGKADFAGAKFRDGLRLERTAFKADVDFSADRDDDRHLNVASMVADSACFAEEVSFVGRNFTGTTSFQDATFSKAPDFHGCALHPATYFPQISGFLDTTSPWAASRYRVLGRAMADMRNHDHEGIFFGLQQRALRKKLPLSSPIRWFSSFYDLASDYGQSLGRPMVLLITTTVLAWCCYAFLVCPGSMALPERVGPSLALTFQQIFRPFSVWTDVGDRGWILAIGAAQTLLTAVWVYLIALGIRWRFRRW